MDKDLLQFVAKIIIIVGAINWGLYGLMNLDLVALIFGHLTIAARLIYILVGVSGAYIAGIDLKLIK
jgi:hypothetical protein